MTKSPITLQELRRRIYVKAKAEKSWRFTWAAFSSQRATVFQAIPLIWEIAEMLTPSTLRAMTTSKVALRCWRR